MWGLWKKRSTDFDTVGRELAKLAFITAGGPLADKFAREFVAGSDVLRRRWRFGFPIVNIVSLIWLVNRARPRPEEAQKVIKPMYKSYFDALRKEPGDVRMGDLIVDGVEWQLLCSQCPFGPLSPDTKSDVYAIATSIYHSRQIEYLDLISKSMAERDTLGPMGGVALRLYEHLTGQRANRQAVLLALTLNMNWAALTEIAMEERLRGIL